MRNGNRIQCRPSQSLFKFLKLYCYEICDDHLSHLKRISAHNRTFLRGVKWLKSLFFQDYNFKFLTAEFKKLRNRLRPKIGVQLWDFGIGLCSLPGWLFLRETVDFTFLLCPLYQLSGTPLLCAVHIDDVVSCSLYLFVLEITLNVIWRVICSL